MSDLALLITMDLEGRLYIEATVFKEFVRDHVGDEDLRDVRIPLPVSVAPKVGKALIDAANAVPENVNKLSN